MAVMVVGSTGDGKSCLGNFLLNPLGEIKYFETATDNVPCTQETRVVTEMVSSSRFSGHKALTVIDTPGLNESHRKDLEHTIGLVETLECINHINACLLVVRFDGKIDTQYKNTLEYYAKLFPALFDRNLAVVLTGFEMWVGAERRRRKEGIDVNAIDSNTLTELAKISGSSVRPELFKIDSLPDEEDLGASLCVRDEVLEYIFSRQPFEMAGYVSLMFSQLLDSKDGEIVLEHDWSD